MKEKDIYIHSTETHNPTSAKEVVPILMELFQVESVADVGCGLGSWLHVFQKNGVSKILGLDGHWVDKNKLLIDEINFREINLIKPPLIQEEFDLVSCLEVAEHLPQEAASTLVSFLTSLGDTIIFSAAIPGQGGQNHINEQWPDYWADLFAQHDFKFYDIIRPKIWNNENIQWWYRQNIFVVSRKELNYPSSNLSLIHPELMKEKTKENQKIKSGSMGLKYSLNILAKSLKKFIFRK